MRRDEPSPLDRNHPHTPKYRVTSGGRQSGHNGAQHGTSGPYRALIDAAYARDSGPREESAAAYQFSVSVALTNQFFVGAKIKGLRSVLRSKIERHVL